MEAFPRKGKGKKREWGSEKKRYKKGLGIQTISIEIGFEQKQSEASCVIRTRDLVITSHSLYQAEPTRHALISTVLSKYNTHR